MTIDYDGVIIGGTIQARRVAMNAAKQGARVALVEPPETVDRQLRRQMSLEVLARFCDQRQQTWLLNTLPPVTPADWAALQQKIDLAVDIAHPRLALDELAIAGVDVVLEPGQFSPQPRLAVTTPSRRLVGRAYLLSPPAEVTLPSIPGLAQAPVLTPETWLELKVPPEKLAILGGSPDAIALAQISALMGTNTTLITHRQRLLPTADPDISKFVESLLVAAGVHLRLGVDISSVSYDGEFILQLADASADALADGHRLQIPHLLIATGRQPQLEGLNLERINVQTSGTAIAVDDQLKTTRPRCFAFGPCLGGYWADHTDDQDGWVALQNALYLPWRTLRQWHRPGRLTTLPEFAYFGITAQQALKYYGDAAQVFQLSCEQIPKLHLDDRITGIYRCIIHRNGAVLGAQIVAPDAADLVQILAFLSHQRVSIQHMNKFPNLSMTSIEVLNGFSRAWQQNRWQIGSWRRDWSENWFNWRRSR
jgi:pyruvate/2-oxoglutarate dehydrogenase complex dihydrolipoamide dehydrogenase (E3) component